MTRLVVRAVPVSAEESLNGYLLRLAAMNGYHDPTWLLRLGNETSSGRPHGPLAALAELTGAAAATLAAVANSTASLPADMIDLVHPKVCVPCLRDRPLLRRSWDVRVALACPRHGTMLIDTCPTCGARLTWCRPGVARCSCRGDLLSADVAAASSALLALAETVDELVAGHFPGAAAAPISDAGAALRLVWFVASDLASGRAGWRSFHMAKPKAADIAHSVAAAASVLLDWPGGLHAWLASRVDPTPKGAGVRAAFGPVLHRMLTRLHGPSFAPLHAEVRTWLASWDGGRVKPWSPLYAPRADALSLTGAEAARRLGVKGARISRLVASGLMEARETRAGSRVFHLVRASAIDALLARCAAAQTVGEGAASLGVTPGQVERMLHAGLLASLRNPPGRSPGMYIEPSAILALQATLDAVCTKRAARGHGRTLAMLSDRGHASLIPTFRAVLSGQLPLARIDAEDGAPLLAHYVVFAARAHGADGQSCLTVREAAAVLHLNVRMIPPLVEANCLDTFRLSTRSALGRRTITTASVEGFQRCYATAHGLAAEQGTSTREVARRLAVAGVAPLVARDKIRGLSAVWRRVDCEVPW